VRGHLLLLLLYLRPGMEEQGKRLLLENHTLTAVHMVTVRMLPMTSRVQ
jgi:hypothetical protein